MSDTRTHPPVLRFPILGDLPHAVTGRRGGVSETPFHSLNVGMATADKEDRVLENRSRAAAVVGKRREDVLVAGVRHGTDVAVYRRGVETQLPDQTIPVRPGSDRRERRFFADGWVSDVPSLAAMFTFADCVPLVLYDTKAHVVGAAHAGWRGTAAGVGPEVLARMHAEFQTDPRDVVVAIGPAIGLCCYQVGAEVIDGFSTTAEPVVEVREGTTFLDLPASNREQLRAAGVPTANIELSGICTSCNTDEYFSHRAESGVTGRFALFVGLRG